MSITRIDFENAFRDAVSYEFRNVPQNDSDIDYFFSDGFEQKMTKLIKQQKKVLWNCINTTAKRIAVFAAIIFISFTTACSFDSVREPLVQFLKEVYETFTKISFEGETSDRIINDFEISDIPEGFQQMDLFEDEVVTVVTYENENGDLIRFTQSTTANTNLFIDSENSEIEKINVSGRDVEIYTQDGLIAGIWIEDTYLFKLFCYGDFTTKDVIQIIQSVKG